MIADFWQKKWDLDVAHSMYKWAASVVDITENEGSQIKEVEVLNALVRHLANNKLLKVIFLGDFKQLPPTVKSLLVSEFGLTALLPPMERMIRAGVPYIMLVTQYRMHPDIVEIVTFLFYGFTLRSDLYKPSD